jgi:hypothetical protein
MRTALSTTLAIVLLAGGTQVASAAGGKGMTWAKASHNSTTGTDLVGCGVSCNAYTGDVSCTQFLPVLCFKPDGVPDPGVTPNDFYNGWTGGHIGLTPLTKGSTLTSLAVANALCVATFGTGYRMAEFHDGGGGWNWHAFANIDPANHFWVYINSTSGNCWNP